MMLIKKSEQGYPGGFNVEFCVYLAGGKNLIEGHFSPNSSLFR